MENKEKKKLLNSKNMIIGSILLIIVIVVIVLLCVLLVKPSNKLKLSDFEKIAVYGYLEDFLSVSKLYAISESSSYDELQYIQSKIKQALDYHYSVHQSEIIPAYEISSILQNEYNISTNTIDYHGILVSDYEYVPNENVFKRVIGANSEMRMIENQIQSIPINSNKISVTSIEKDKQDRYIVYFNIIDTTRTEASITETGNVTLKIVNNNFEIEKCNIN